MHVNTYLYQRIYRPLSVFVYNVVNDIVGNNVAYNGVGDTSYTCFCGVSVVCHTYGIWAVVIMIASCCCCFHAAIAIPAGVDGVNNGVAHVVVRCGRLNNRVYATACNIDVCTAGVGTVGCDFNVAGGVRFDDGVDAICVGVDFLFFVFCHVFIVLEKLGVR
jgi:hypothetical protein